ncbi:MAG TPA: DnaA regulatory inactivator Hda [Steroidobacteraceae bacterium]|jgi:DnaA family protein
MQQLPLAIGLRERAVFESFVPGPNLQAVEQLRSIAQSNAAEVCWLCGPAGVGKTHLLQAACALSQRNGEMAAYLPLAQLLRHGPEALEGWHGARVLAVDDLDQVAGDLSWEQRLFGLYREAQERGAVLIVAALAPPLLLHFALADLASRFAAATLLPVRALPEAAQREALRLRAHARGLELPEETALYLQRRFRRDLPTLYDLLDTIDGAALQAQRRLTVPFIRSVLSPHVPE